MNAKGLFALVSLFIITIWIGFFATWAQATAPDNINTAKHNAANQIEHSPKVASSPQASFVPLRLTADSITKIDLQDWLYIHKTQEISKLPSILSEPISQWQALKQDANHRIGVKNIWVAMSIYNPDDEMLSRIIALDNPLLDSIKLYHFIDGKITNFERMGDTLPFNQRPLHSNIFLYPFDIEPQQTHTFYLRIDTKGNMNLPMTLWSPNDLTETMESSNLLHGIQIGMLLAIAVFSLFIALASGSYSYSYYCGYVLGISLMIITLHGVGFQFIWPESPKLQQHVLIIILPIILAFSLMFTEKVLQLKYRNINMLRTCRILAVSSLALSLLLPLIDYSVSLYIVFITIMVTLSWMAGVALVQSLSGIRNATLYFIARLGLLTGGMVSGLLYFGILDLNWKLQTPVTFGLTFEVIIMAAVLAIRYNEERKDKLRIQQKALEQAERIRQNREEAVRIEEETNERLENMVQERTLELEVTLRELNDVNQKLTEQSTTDPLTGVKNRHAFDKRLVAEGRISRRQQTPMGLLMVDIDKFKPINDQYGHLAGDSTIQAIAKTLSAQIKRPTDLVSRFGGEEFAIILPNTTKQGAMVVAEQMRKAVSELQIHWQGQSFPLTISIGVCVAIIEDETHPMQLLDQADKALYDAKRSGRNKVCYFEQTTE
ncbi:MULTISPECIES: diguanylate cyclase [Shewanella]|uniref:sensor domain-containing diguanylate cyclase n=1 Tax=Shewanella TaxID=22 RepID=UPI001F5E8FD4|nr:MULTISPECIES: diguanylate cyclase [Shewanella]